MIARLAKFSAILLVAGCAADFDADHLRRDARATSPYELRLAEGYLALAEAERAESDYRDAATFADRAAQAFNGAPPEPELLDARDLPAGLLEPAAARREAITRFRADGAEVLSATHLADAQVAFDCWLQEAEEGHQQTDVAECLARLEAALEVLAAQGPTAIFVLLEPDGPEIKPTSIEVRTEAGAAVLDQPGQAAKVDAASAPESLGALMPSQVEALFGAALLATPSPPERFVLYFVPGGSELTPESAALLPKALAAVTRRVAPRIDVVGHTDRVGSDQTNTRLARARADAVAELLIEAGASRQSIAAASFGERDNAVPTADGVAEPGNRRVEVLVR